MSGCKIGEVTVEEMAKDEFRVKRQESLITEDIEAEQRVDDYVAR